MIMQQELSLSVNTALYNPDKNSSGTKKERLHLTFLDGIRGLAAFYVLLFHVVANGDSQLFSESFLINFLRFGHEAVVVFIVLSGFVLTLPVSRSPGLLLPPDGPVSFIKRRARRILPAYYAALFMLPLYFLAVESLKQLTNEGASWTHIKDIFISYDMLSHLFLLQNLSPAWETSINPVLWSMATEWWIYFIFALVLIPIWRHFGVFIAVSVSILLGLVPKTMLLLDFPTLVGSPHLLGAFGLGMLSASLLFNSKFTSQYKFWRKVLKFIAILVFIVFCWIVISFPSIRLREATQWVTDLLLALVIAIFILLTASARISNGKAPGIIAKVTQGLEMRPFVFLGQFSYSLYLTHLVIWSILGITLGLAPVKRLVSFSLDPMPIRLFLAIPLLLTSAYGFYLLFEKPFLSRR